MAADSSAPPIPYAHANADFTASAGPLLAARGVSLRLRAPDGRPLDVLEDVSLDIAPGEFVALIGPSGCGKTSLLTVLAGLQRPTAGDVLLRGDAQARRLGRIGYMPQGDSLLPWRTAIENAVAGLQVRGVPRAERLRRARALFATFGLAEFERAYPSRLSGGMRQRVAFARTVLATPQVMLLDEPFGALDALTRASLQRWLAEIWGGLGATCLLVTHDIDEALLLADRIYVMSPRPGTIRLERRVPLPRPRRLEALTTPAAITLKRELLAALVEDPTPPWGERAPEEVPPLPMGEWAGGEVQPVAPASSRPVASAEVAPLIATERNERTENAPLGAPVKRQGERSIGRALPRLLRAGLPTVALLVALVALWQWYATQPGASPLILPPPSSVWTALVTQRDALWANGLITLQETLLGFAAALVAGALLGIIVDASPWLRRAVYPLLVTSQTIPLITLAPLMVLWFGFGLTSKIVVVLLVCFFPITVNLADGLRAADPEVIKLYRAFGARALRIFWSARLPGALPALFSGIRIGITYSVVGAIFAEYVGAEAGLGLYMRAKQSGFAINAVLATVLVAALLSIALFALVTVIERIALPWYYLERSKQA